MSGRRLRDTIRQVLSDNGADNNSIVLIAGLSNDYSHYITTFEEFHYQRYEGASTLYGPHTLAAYQQQYSILAQALAKGTPVPPGPTPPDLSGDTFSFQPGPIVDGTPWGGYFGEVAEDVDSIYTVGDTVSVSFWGGDPRNDFRTQDTFLSVDWNGNSRWQTIATDGDLSTMFLWERRGLDESYITINWNIPQGTTSGQYRICTYGSSRDIFQYLTPYVGCSSNFNVTQSKF